MMDPDRASVHSTWKEKWEKGTTRWHKDYVEPILQRHLHLIAAPDAHLSIFVPLCGKTLDMVWLCQQGHTVVGCELSEIAALDFFKENSIPYKTHQEGSLVMYEATDRSLKFVLGDFFNCTPENIGLFDGMWDCNAFGAICPEERNAYVDKLATLTKPNGRILLTALEYDESLRSATRSPPYSVIPAVTRSAFESHFKYTLVETLDITETSKLGVPWLLRHIYYLEKKN